MQSLTRSKMSNLRRRRSYIWVWFTLENVPKETLLPRAKSYNTSSSNSGNMGM